MRKPSAARRASMPSQDAPRGVLVGCGAVVERRRERLVLRRPARVGREGVDPRRPRLGLRVELQAVLADVRQPVDADDLPCPLARAAADAGDERVARRETLQLGAGRVGDAWSRPGRRRSAPACRPRRGRSRRGSGSAVSWSSASIGRSLAHTPRPRQRGPSSRRGHTVPVVRKGRPRARSGGCRGARCGRRPRRLRADPPARAARRPRGPSRSACSCRAANPVGHGVGRRAARRDPARDRRLCVPGRRRRS